MYSVKSDNRVAQGDVFTELEFKYLNEDNTANSVIFPFWVVLSQDCDLEHDFNASDGKYSTQDKKLQTILICPAFISEQLRSGTHMAQIEWKMENWSSDPWRLIKKNRDYRFHILPADDSLLVPELVIDFKRFFTLPRDYVYSNIDKKVASIDNLFKESLSQRFAYYLSRVALPDSEF